MGIHVHVKGQPDLCGCCAVKEKLDTLWDRASGAVLTINGVYPDAMGAITVDLLQEAAVQSLIEDYIEPMQDNLDAMNTRLDGYIDIFDNYGAILQAVNVTIPGEIDDVQDYAEAIADDLLQNYLTKQVIISRYATKAEIQGLATKQDIQNVINGYIAKQGTDTPQVISGSGGLQIAGDLAVGGDFTASGGTFVHWDNIAGAEIGPITISGSTINIPDYVTINTVQDITHYKNFKAGSGSDYVFRIINKDEGHSVKYKPPGLYFAYPLIEKGSDGSDFTVMFRYQDPDGNTGLAFDVNNVNREGGDITTARVELRNQRDGQMYLSGPSPSDNSPSSAYVTKANVMSTNGKLNNLIHTIGDETKNGKLTITRGNYDVPLVAQNTEIDVTRPQSREMLQSITFVDANEITLGGLRVGINELNKYFIQAEIRNSDGTYKYVNLATGD